MRYLALARPARPRMASIQNAYSLLNRSFEVGLAEVAAREQCGLLAYSPLAMGALSGKYLDGAWPDGARLTIWKHFKRYLTPSGVAATAAYVKLAGEHGLDPRRWPWPSSPAAPSSPPTSSAPPAWTSSKATSPVVK
jgi:aryl-alcohol dehydrogenase-like predicted oxidoreductase